LGKLFTHIDSESNRRSGVALAMRHRLKWFTQIKAQGLRKGDEHPPTLFMGYDTLYRYLFIDEGSLRAERCFCSSDRSLRQANATKTRGAKSSRKSANKSPGNPGQNVPLTTRRSTNSCPDFFFSVERQLTDDVAGRAAGRRRSAASCDQVATEQRWAAAEEKIRLTDEDATSC